MAGGPRAQEQSEKSVYTEMPAVVGVADLLQDERVQAVLREMVLVAGSEMERQLQPEPEPHVVA